MPNIKIEITNDSQTLDDAEVRAAVPALQEQIHRDFAPAWGIDADLSYVAPSKLSDHTWWLVVLDNSDQAGALGYHDLTTFMPLGKVFAKTDELFHLNWTVTAGHELLEMLADPDINLTAFDQPTDTSGTLYAYEVADACEDEQYAYDINGTIVSDFVFPSWFQPNRPSNGTQFDQGNHIKQPLELLPGGYIGVFEVGSGWTQKTFAAQAPAYAQHPRVGSRRERRRTPRDQRRASEQSP